MSMKREKAEYRMGTGATSMLMIFIVLCLTTLSILSLSTARTDLEMSRRSVTMTQAYYDAADRVQVILSEIDAQLSALQKGLVAEKRAEFEAAYADAEYIDQKAFDQMILEAANEAYISAARGVQVEDVEITVPADAEDHLTFSVDAQNDRFIQVEIALDPPGGDTRYHIYKHVMVYLEDWEPEYEYELFTDPEYDEVDGSPGEADVIMSLDDLELNLDDFEDDLQWID